MDEQLKTNKVITFYSYKGGVGRTMALANIAFILASQGKKVLLIDWDLEAPGLHRYLYPFLNDKDIIETKGVIDFLRTYVDASLNSDIPSGEGWYEPYVNILEYAQTLKFKFKIPDFGKIDFISAGKQDDVYSAKVNLFDWNLFYRKFDGAAFLDIVKDKIKQEYDYILLDSRTGESDTFFTCTCHMADMLIMLFTPNNQNIEGASRVATFVCKKWEEMGLERSILPIISRLDLSEARKFEIALKRGYYKFEKYIDSFNMSYKQWYETALTYVPLFNYEERIDFSSEIPLSSKYANIAKKILSIEELTVNIFSPEYECFTKEIDKLYDRNYLQIDNLSFSRNNFFTGRKDILDTLFRDSRTVEVLVGISGIGKTQLAIEYVLRNKDKYDVIWWVNNNSEDDLKKLAIKLQLGKPKTKMQEILNRLKTWLQTNSNWILIFDNADSDEIINFFQPILTGNILVTSRIGCWDNSANITVVDSFANEQAIEFLLNRTNCNERDKALQLTELLGNFPMALEQAGTYIHVHRISISKYIDMYLKNPIKLMERSGLLSTWRISLEKIQKTESQELLYLLAFLSPDGIEREIFTDSKGLLPESLSGIVEDEIEFNDILMELFQFSIVQNKNDDTFCIHPLLQECIRDTLSKKGEYEKYCYYVEELILQKFIFDKEKDDTWDICGKFLKHALALETCMQCVNHKQNHIKILNRIGQYYEWEEEIFDKAEIFLRKAFKIQEELENEGKLDCISCTNNIGNPNQDKKTSLVTVTLPSINDENTDNDDIVENNIKRTIEIFDIGSGDTRQDKHSLISDLALLALKQGNYKLAEERYKDAIDYIIKDFGENNLYIVDAYCNLATTYQRSGKYCEADEYYKKALEMQKKKCETISIANATILSGLASLNVDTGKYAEAERCYQEALEILYKLGEKNQNTAILLSGLAGLYQNSGDFKRAENLYKEALEIRREVLSDKHQDIAVSYNNLARLYHAQRNYSLAERYYINALEVKKWNMGIDDLSTADIYNNLAGMFQCQGKYKEAEENYQYALDIFKKTVGVEHPSTATLFSNIASLYLKQGRYDQAEQYYTKVLEIRLKILGNNHIDTATTLSNLAFVNERLGKYGEAEANYNTALELKTQILGDDHSSIATTLNGMAGLYESQGDYQKAVNLYKKALAIKCYSLGTNNSETAIILSNLAGVYECQGIYNEAEINYNKALEIKRNVLGDNHPSTSITISALAGVYESQGRYEDAEKYYNIALGIKYKVFGSKHPSIATTLNNLALLYECMGRYDEAESYFSKALSINEETFGREHPDTAITLHNLASINQIKGDYNTAEGLYLSALETRTKIFGDNHPIIANSLNGLAELYYNQQKYLKSRNFYLRALNIRENTLGDKHPLTAETLCGLATVYCKLNNFESAEKIHKKSLKIREEALGKNHPDTATSLKTLADLYQEMGRYNEAELLYFNSLFIRKEKLGEFHPDVANTMNSLGELRLKQGMKRDAMDFFEKALYIRKQVLGEMHNDTVDVKKNLYLSQNEIINT